VMLTGPSASIAAGYGAETAAGLAVPVRSKVPTIGFDPLRNCDPKPSAVPACAGEAAVPKVKTPAADGLLGTPTAMFAGVVVPTKLVVTEALISITRH